VGKELVYHSLEFGRRQIASGRAIILTEFCDLRHRQRQMPSQESGAINRLLLSAAVDRRNLRDPGLPQEQTHTR
jgi:hypothetical protein